MKRNMKSTKGFTLVEMLGVLAIIAILVSVVSVGVMSAIRSARITGTVANLKNYETAVAAHIAFNEGNGFIPLTKGATTPLAATGVAQANVHVGQVLLASGAFEQLPAWRVGKEILGANSTLHATWNVDQSIFEGTAATSIWTDRARAECVIAGAPSATSALIDEGANTATFVLNRPIVQGAKIVYVKIPNVSIADAIELSKSINRKEVNTATEINPVQRIGKFVFDASATPSLVVNESGTPAEAGTVHCYYFVGTF